MWQVPSALLFNGAEGGPSCAAAGQHKSIGENIEASSENSSMPGQEGGLSDGVLLVCSPQCWGYCLCEDRWGQMSLQPLWAAKGLH